MESELEILTAKVKECEIMALKDKKTTSALFSCKIQDYPTQCLWDTGANISLISKRLLGLAGMAEQTFKFAKTRKIKGISDNFVFSTEGVKMVIEFQDKRKREIECVVCAEVPNDFIVGLPFMNKHKISFVPGEEEFQLMDCKHDNGIIASSSGISHLSVNIGEIETNVEQTPIISKHADSKLNPTLQHAFNCKLIPDVDGGCVIDKLCGTGKFVIDDTNLPKQALEAFSVQNCYLASSCQNSEASPVKGAEPLDLTPNQRKRLDALLEEFSDVFANSASDVGKANFEPWRIRLVNKDPVALRNYRTPLQYRDWLKQELQDLQDAGIIEHSESPYNSPALVVPKKLDVNQDSSGKDATASKGARLVIDYRQVNKALEDANFPIPRIQDLILDLKDCNVFSAMDIRHAFYTIEIHPDSRKVTAFSCEFGKYQFKFLPQGLKISPAIFQQRISTALMPYPHSNAYMDDVNTGTRGVNSHFTALRETFTAMRKYNFKLKKGKSLFFYKRIPIVGHMVSGEGITIDPEKLEGVEKLVPPKTVGEVRTLMGFVNFLRDHVSHFADIVAPIQDLVTKGNNKSGTNIEQFWDEKCDLSLKTLKEALVSNEVLAFPDVTKPYELFTDASGRHMSGVLMQKDENGKNRPIGYFAKSFQNTQKNWAALTKEAYAVYKSVEFFSVFITGAKVTLRCDHKPLERFLIQDTRNQMVNRWSLNMQQYDIDFEWVATDKNISDCLSRLIKTGLYDPHEAIEEDFELFPKKSQVLVAAEQDLDKTVELPRPIRNQDMKHLQTRDAYCQRVLELLDLDKNASEKFTTKDGLLYRVVVSRDRVTSLALVIPPKLGLSVIASVHTELMHPGNNKMIDSLRFRVYWKGMAKQIRQFVSGCPTCMLRTLKQDSYPLKHDNPPSGPWKRMAMDFAGSGYGETKDGNKAVLTVICLHSQYPYAVPVKDKTAASAVVALNSVLSQVSSCQELLSDNGPEFASEEMKRYLEGLSVKHRTTAPYCPQSNGVLERWHKFMNNVVRLCHPIRQDNNWEPAVEAAVRAYRCIPHASSGYSPHYLAFKETPVLDLDRMLPTLRMSHSEPGVADKVLDQMRVAFGLARKNVCLSRQRNKNSKTKVPTKAIQVGDLVVMKDNRANKGQSPWKIGYKVIEMLSERSARVEHLKTGKKYKVGLQHVKHAEPLALLLDNSQIDLFPGRTKLFLPAQDLPDLNWPPQDVQHDMGELDFNKLVEAARDRSGDRDVQKPTSSSGDPLINKGVTRTRSGRTIKTTRNSDFVYITDTLLNEVPLTRCTVFLVKRAALSKTN